MNEYIHFFHVKNKKEHMRTDPCDMENIKQVQKWQPYKRGIDCIGRNMIDDNFPIPESATYTVYKNRTCYAINRYNNVKDILENNHTKHILFKDCPDIIKIFCIHNNLLWYPCD